ncbi:FG-GAP repeat domain-containing protein [Streptomyces sp. NPDC101118]|uniref:FG-GAP repeat domain-containing protein n=1 Tax=Streptomyces sp. NPDC101118 TaxID=3366109 RepID=UPI0037F54DCF
MRKHVLATAAFCAAATLGTAALTTATAATPAATPAGAPVPAKPRTADFNGDGYPDLAIGAHTATVNGIKGAGVVTVAYGSAGGLKLDTATVVSRATPGVPGDPAENDKWRAISGFGDLDGDGYDDLLVRHRESTLVLWGGKAGLTGASTAVTGSGTAADPKVLAGFHGVGDVNGDGTDDLVTRGHDGAEYGVSVFLGPLDRATGKAAKVWHRNTQRVDGFSVGISLYVGDMTGDRTDDIVLTGLGGPGLVLKGGAAGLAPGAKLQMDGSGGAGTFGDLDKDGYQDLVIGLGGRVSVQYGGPNGASTTRPRGIYGQDQRGIPGVEQSGDGWGNAVSIADTNRDGYPDLLVGAPGKSGNQLGEEHSGSLTVLFGSSGGGFGGTGGGQYLDQNTRGIPSTSEYQDRFGAAVVAIDGDKDGNPEVYVGGHGEDGYTGRVWKLHTSATGLTGTGATSFGLTALGGPAGWANFGYRLLG